MYPFSDSIYGGYRCEVKLCHAVAEVICLNYAQQQLH